jgi:hypothetical protein
MGVPARLAMIFNKTIVANSWVQKTSWVEETLLALFIIWPIGIMRCTVLDSLNNISLLATRDVKIMAAVNLIRKVVCGIEETNSSSQMDIASLRMLFPRLSWYAHFMIIKMAQMKNLRSVWVEMSLITTFAPLFMMIPSASVATRIFRSWALSNRASGSGIMISDESEFKELMNFLNCTVMGEETKWISKRFKSRASNPEMMVYYLNVDLDEIKFADSPMSDDPIDEALFESVFLTRLDYSAIPTADISW